MLYNFLGQRLRVRLHLRGGFAGAHGWQRSGLPIWGLEQRRRCGRPGWPRQSSKTSTRRFRPPTCTSWPPPSSTTGSRQPRQIPSRWDLNTTLIKENRSNYLFSISGLHEELSSLQTSNWGSCHSSTNENPAHRVRHRCLTVKYHDQGIRTPILEYKVGLRIGLC
jgi:hypothetical protein